MKKKPFVYIQQITEEPNTTEGTPYTFKVYAARADIQATFQFSGALQHIRAEASKKSKNA